MTTEKELIEASALKLIPREEIKFEVIHVLIETDVSRQFKPKIQTLPAFLRGLTLTFSGMLENLIAGPLEKMDLSAQDVPNST